MRLIESHTAARRQRGLSVVELLVGFAVGLFIVGGATKLLVDYLGNNRKLLLDTRVNQDLRAAADLVARDLRRTGYWRGSLSNFWIPNGNGGTYTANAYRPITLAGAVPAGACPAVPGTTMASGGEIQFGYAKDTDNARDGNTELRGFRIAGNVLQAYNAGDWQAVTDVNSVLMTMAVCEYTSTVPLWDTCPCIIRGTCTNAQFQAGGAFEATRPRALVAQYVVTLNATSATDGAVRRTLSESVRLPNDDLLGTCPDL